MHSFYSSNRLLTLSHSKSRYFSFPKNSSPTTYTTNSLDQYTTLTGATNTTYTYDNNGNISSDGTKSYTYDYQNRIIQVTQSGTTLASYQYDPLGRRVEKSTPTETTRYTYAGDNIIQEKKTIGSITLKKVYINGIGVDNIIAYEADEIPNQDKITFCNARVLPYESEFTTYGYSTIVSDCNDTVSSSTGVTTKRYYYHINHLGSVIGITNGSGNVVQKYTYDSFGKPYIVNGSGTLTSLDTYSGNTYSNTRLYTGREYDSETKLYYLRARYYDANLGRFISRDPIGQNDQINLYTYVANSPMNYVDRMGKEKALAIIVDRFNFFGAYFENLTSFITPKYFSQITVNPSFGNIKLSPEIRERAIFIDENYQTNKSGMKIQIEGKDIWLADIGNMLFAYNAAKVGYDLDFLKFAAFLPTAVAGDLGYKKGGAIKNEMEDWKFYESGFNLGKKTKTGELTREDILDTYFDMFPNGR